MADDTTYDYLIGSPLSASQVAAGLEALVQQAEAARNEAETFAVNAENSATTAQTEAGNAASSASEAATSASAASGSASSASSSASSASSSASTADSAKTAAEAARDAAQTAQTAAETARGKANEWAEKAEDAEVETGQFSALHHAAKAATSASTASTEADNAATSAGNAASSASAASTSASNAASSASMAATHESGAQAARDKSQEWAENPEDSAVEAGQFSSLHHAAKAASSASSAATSASNAASSASAAGTSATNAANAQTAAESARDEASDWAEGVEPGGTGTKSAKGHAEDAESYAASLGGGGVVDPIPDGIPRSPADDERLDEAWLYRKPSSDFGSILTPGGQTTLQSMRGDNGFYYQLQRASLNVPGVAFVFADGSYFEEDGEVTLSSLVSYTAPTGAYEWTQEGILVPASGNPRTPWYDPLNGEKRGLVTEQGDINEIDDSEVSSSTTDWANPGFTITAATSIIQGQTAWKHQGYNQTFAFRNQITQNDFGGSSTREMLYFIVENVDADETRFGLFNSSGLVNNWAVRATWDWASKSFTELGVNAGSDARSFAIKLRDVGPNGGEVWLLAVSVLPTVSLGNDRRVRFYPTGSSANTQSIIVHHAQLSEKNVISSPIVSPVNTLGARTAESIVTSAIDGRSWWNATTWSGFGRVTVPYGGQFGSNAYQILWSYHNGTADHRIDLVYAFFDSRIAARFDAPDGSEVFQVLAENVGAGATVYFAYRVVENDICLAVNGTMGDKIERQVPTITAFNQGSGPGDGLPATTVHGRHVIVPGQAFDDNTLLTRSTAIAEDGGPPSGATPVLDPFTITVGDGGDYPTLQAALDFLSAFRPMPEETDLRHIATVQILSGHVLSPTYIQNRDLGWVQITAIGGTVLGDAGGTSTDLITIYNSRAPYMRCIIDGQSLCRDVIWLQQSTMMGHPNEFGVKNPGGSGASRGNGIRCEQSVLRARGMEASGCNTAGVFIRQGFADLSDAHIHDNPGFGVSCVGGTVAFFANAGGGGALLENNWVHLGTNFGTGVISSGTEWRNATNEAMWIMRGSAIDMTGDLVDGAGTDGIFCYGGIAVLNTTQIENITGQGLRAMYGGRIGFDAINGAQSDVIDALVENGGQIAIAGSIGVPAQINTNIAVNTLSPKGIIFHDT